MIHEVLPQLLTPSIYSSWPRRNMSPPGLGGRTQLIGRVWRRQGREQRQAAAFPALQFHLLDLSGWIFQQLSYFTRKGEATDEKGNSSLLESNTDLVSVVTNSQHALFSRTFYPLRSLCKQNITWGFGVHWFGGPGVVPEVQPPT